MKGKRVGVIMGGVSSEREVSLRSGKAILEALRSKGVDAIPLEVGEDLVQKVLEAKIDVAFLALHGRLGEDGTVQGLLELLRIPYTGSGVLASALAMNKIKAKEIFLHHQIPTPEFIVWHEGTQPPFPPPWVVKPASEGSTIGVSVARDEEELGRAVQEARRYDHQILIEKFIEGKELTVGILDGSPLEVIEIVPKKGIYDYGAKYTLLDEQGVWITEVNTLPGMTSTSLVPKAAASEGISFPELVMRILEGASLKIEVGGGR